MSPEGTVYLLHFEHPYNGPMQHYVGFTASDLDQRLKDHRAGTGAVTTRRAFEQGIAFTVVRTWRGTLKLERQIKARGPGNYCPLCPRRRRGRDIRPSNLIGANGFAVEGRGLGGRGFCASKTRPEGAP
jgi:predicted GIY-YIG superfamily endonuclease